MRDAVNMDDVTKDAMLKRFDRIEDNLTRLAREYGAMKVALEEIAADPCRSCYAAGTAENVLKRVNGEEPL